MKNNSCIRADALKNSRNQLKYKCLNSARNLHENALFVRSCFFRRFVRDFSICTEFVRTLCRNNILNNK